MKRIAMLALFGGCSFFSHGLATSPTTCNPSRLAPGWDAYNAVGGGVLAIGMAGEANDGDGIAAVMAIGGAVLGSLHAAGAVYGFRHARACRELRAGLEPPAMLVPVEQAPPPIIIEEDEETTTTTRTKRTIIVP